MQRLGIKEGASLTTIGVLRFGARNPAPWPRPESPVSRPLINLDQAILSTGLKKDADENWPCASAGLCQNRQSGSVDVLVAKIASAPSTASAFCVDLCLDLWVFENGLYHQIAAIKRGIICRRRDAGQNLRLALFGDLAALHALVQDILGMGVPALGRVLGGVDQHPPSMPALAAT